MKTLEFYLPKGNKKGRPPAAWLALEDVKQMLVTVKDLVEITGEAPTTIRAVLRRHNVPHKPVEHDGDYLRGYDVKTLRTLYKKLHTEYYMNR